MVKTTARPSCCPIGWGATTNSSWVNESEVLIRSAEPVGSYTSREMPDDGAFLPLLLTKEGGGGRGEEARFIKPPPLQLSPHSFLVGREGTCADTNAEGERVPKAGEGAVNGFKARADSGNSLPGQEAAAPHGRWRRTELRAAASARLGNGVLLPEADAAGKTAHYERAGS